MDTVRIDVSAGRVLAHMVGPLKVERGTPTLTVVRRFINKEERPMSVSVSQYPEGRYMFSLEFKREWRPD